MSLFGVLNINKPAGWTSRQVVNRVQRHARPAKVGHAGTLDPLADGVLLVLVGPATRLTEYAHQQPKNYRGTFLLGQRSPTDDTEAEPELLAGAPQPTRRQIESALPRFLGDIEQLPPTYSAVKVQGQRAYELARRGKQVELTRRTVTIHSLEVVTYEYPQLVLDIACGSGTYIRALGRDLARSLGTAAVMSNLTRTGIGPFRLATSLAGEAIDRQTIERHLQPPQRLLGDLPVIRLSPAECQEVAHGRPIAGRPGQSLESVLAAIDEEDRLVGLLRVKNDFQLWPVRNFARKAIGRSSQQPGQAGSDL